MVFLILQFYKNEGFVKSCGGLPCFGVSKTTPSKSTGWREVFVSIRLVAAAEEHVEQPAEAGDEGRDVGVGGGVECFIDADQFVLIDDAEADELGLGALAGVEFDG